MFKQRKAFTLIELLLLILIFTLIGTVVFISLQGYHRDTRNATRLTHSLIIKESLEFYKKEKGFFPSPDSYKQMIFNNDLTWKQGYFGKNVVTNLGAYILELPLDPLFKTEYSYSTTLNNDNYKILIEFEGGNGI